MLTRDIWTIHSIFTDLSKSFQLFFLQTSNHIPGDGEDEYEKFRKLEELEQAGERRDVARVRMTEQKWSWRHFSKVEASDDTFHSISPTEALYHSTHLISYQRLILSLSELKSPLTKHDEGSSALDSIAVALSTNIL